ncbi:protein CMSS1 isoform X3 [Sander vitreus]
MGDDLGDEWWTHEGNSGASEAEEETQLEKQPTEKPNAKTKPEKRKSVTEKTVKAKKTKKNEQKECIIPPKKETEDEKSTKPKRKRKKKTITDVLSSSEPKPGCPADLQSLVTQYFSDKLSVIEQEELKLLDSSFLSSNDLTHTLSSYLKQVCPKWSKIQKQHKEKSSVVLLIVCSSALRTIELIKQLTAFKGEAKALKLFAKHIKVVEMTVQCDACDRGAGEAAAKGRHPHRSGDTWQDQRSYRERRFGLAGVEIRGSGLELEGPEAPKDGGCS